MLLTEHKAMPVPGKMRFIVRDVNVIHFLATGEVKYRDWYDSAGEKHVHLHLNIAPDGSFLAGDGQPDCPYICRLDWKEDSTIAATPLCRPLVSPSFPGYGPVSDFLSLTSLEPCEPERSGLLSAFSWS